MVEISADTNAAEWEELQRVTRYAKTGRRDDAGAATGPATSTSKGASAVTAVATAGNEDAIGSPTDTTAASPTESSTAGSPNRDRRKRNQPRQQKQLDKYGFIVDVKSTSVGSSLNGRDGDNSDVLSLNDTETRRRPQTQKYGGGGGDKASDTNGTNPAGKNETDKEHRVTVRREKKWSKMMSSWDRTKTKKKKKLRRRIRKGVPHSVRGAAWAKLGNVHHKIKVEEVGTYDDLVRRSADVATPTSDRDDDDLDEYGPFVAARVGQETDRSRATPSATRETIERDINRTFPRHHMFAESSSSESDSDSDSDYAGDGGDGDGENDGHDGLTPDDSDLAPSEKADDDRVPAWGRGDSAAEMGAGGAEGKTDENDGGSTSFGAEPEDGRQKGSQESSAIVAPHKADGGQAVNISKKLLDAMQKCNANLEQVDMMMSSATGGTVPTRAEIMMSAAALEDGKAVMSVGSADNNGGASTRKLTKEERRELRRANYERATGGQASLRRVLRAYSVYDKEVGYCQGMNFIAAMFIAFMSEEEAFWLLVSVMNEPPCKMRGLFGVGMAGAHQVLHVAEKLIGQFLPKLSRHLDKENIHITMYATQWLLTLYTSSFPFDLVTRVWDCFLAEGWKIVYRVMLALLDQASPDLMKLRFEEILGYFRELPSKVDGEKVFERAFVIPLRRRHIEKYEKEWQARQQNS